MAKLTEHVKNCRTYNAIGNFGKKRNENEKCTQRPWDCDII